MKITDIITETLDAKLHKMVTDMNRGMTVKQFIELVSHQHKVEIEYIQKEGIEQPDVKKAAFASMVDDQSPESKTMQFTIIGPDDKLDYDMPVKEITRFINTYKHEMSHYFQHQSENGNSQKLHNEYINASAEGWIEYFVQAKERPAMITNINVALMELDMKPAEYFKHVGQANSIVSGQFERFLKKHDVIDEVKANWADIDPEADEAFNQMVIRMGAFLTSNYAEMMGGNTTILMRVLRTFAFYNNFYRIQGHQDRSDRLKAQFGAFKRLLLKKSSRSSAYTRDAEK